MNKALIIEGANRCVLCGLCMPHCTTYRHAKQESESPRGRIALMKAFAEGHLPYNDHLQQHIDHCLGCNACETVCPAKVPYTQIIDQSKALLRQHQPKNWKSYLANIALLHIIPYPKRLRAIAKILKGFQPYSQLLRPAALQQQFKRLPKLEPLIHWQNYYPTKLNKQGDVALFLGCIASVLDAHTLNSAIRLLNACGFGVFIPQSQTCCGALHQHNGHLAAATKLAKRNLAAFDLPIQAVISTATGCFPQLKSLSVDVIDIHQFLLTQPTLPTFKPCKQTVLVHEPCSLNSETKQSMYQLLARIPGLDAQPLSDQPFCCGAGGSHMLKFPTLADEFAQDKLRNLPKQTTILTANIGCQLHLANQHQLKTMTVTHSINFAAGALGKQILNTEP